MAEMAAESAESKKRTKDRKKKWTWKDDQVEDLISFLKEYKVGCDFKGIDFEADLKALYTELHRCMCLKYITDFGPKEVSEPFKPVKEMTSTEYASYKVQCEDDKSRILKAYDRIKQKVISIRQDYRTAVNTGTRSGSGKIVKEHYDTLTEIWGGSPATSMIIEGIDGDVLETNSKSENQELDTQETKNPNDEENAEEQTTDDTSESEVCEKKPKVSVSRISTLVDNKRKHMEKSLSQAKRDMILMTSAKEDQIVKKEMVTAFENSNKALESNMERMTQSLSSMAEGMKMIAMALAATPQMHPSQFSSPHNFSFPNNYGSMNQSHIQMEPPFSYNFPSGSNHSSASPQRGDSPYPYAPSPCSSSALSHSSDDQWQ